MNWSSLSQKFKKKLRIGIAGTGLMGRWHAFAAERSGASVVAMADTDPDALDSLASRYRSVSQYRDVETMLTDSEIDVLHVCTPVSTHVPITLSAIDSNVHVLIEKPMTGSAQETRQLMAAAKSRALILSPVHQFVFQRGVLQARGRMTDIGRIVRMDGVFFSAGAEGRSDVERSQIVADILPHPISLMEHFSARSLPLESWSVEVPAPGEFQATGMSGGTTLSIQISMSGRPTRSFYTITGTEGTIELDLFHGYSFFHNGSVSRTRKIMAPFQQAVRQLTSASANLGRRTLSWEPAYPGLLMLVGKFYDAVLTGSPPPFSSEHILEVALVRDHLLHLATGHSRS